MEEKQINELGEFGLIARWSSGALSGEGVVVGIGDDCAVLQLNARAELLATTDALVEAIHFDLQFMDPWQLGYKALVVNLSDIAAMGGIPRFALIAVGLPPETPLALADQLYAGLYAAARPWGVSVVGGDTVSAPQLYVNVTILGEVEAGCALLRSRARSGDLVLVTGDVGASRAGLAICQQEISDLPPEDRAYLRQRHLQPTARLAEGRIIAAHGATSAIDISDGLASEANHLAYASGVSLRIDATSLPIAGVTQRAAQRMGQSHQDWALYGGEDYELLFTAPPSAVCALQEAIRAQTTSAVTVIGNVLEGSGCSLVSPQGEAPLVARGYTHFTKQAATGSLLMPAFGLQHGCGAQK